MRIKLLVLSLAFLASCEQPCEIPATKTKVDTSVKKEMTINFNNNVSLTGDRTINGNVHFKNGLNLNGQTLTVNGTVKVWGYLNGGGTLEYCGTLKAKKVQNNPTLTDICGTLSVDDNVDGEVENIFIPCETETPYIVQEDGVTYVVE